jgi:hypothetical protein
MLNLLSGFRHLNLARPFSHGRHHFFHGTIQRDAEFGDLLELNPSDFNET